MYTFKRLSDSNVFGIYYNDDFVLSVYNKNVALNLVQILNRDLQLNFLHDFTMFFPSSRSDRSD